MGSEWHRARRTACDSTDPKARSGVFNKSKHRNEQPQAHHTGAEAWNPCVSTGLRLMTMGQRTKCPGIESSEMNMLMYKLKEERE